MTQKRQLSLIAALVCVAVLAAGFMILVKPQHSKASSIKSQTGQVQQQVSALQAQLAELKSEQQGITGEQAKLARYVQQLPKDPQQPTLLRKVQEAADSSKVDLTTLNSAAPAAFTAASGTSSTAPAASGTGGLQVIAVSMSVTGTYFEVEQFLDAIEGLQRSMLVNTFSIATGGSSTTGSSATSGSSSSSTDPDAVSVTINASVFEAPDLTQATSTSTAPATTGSGS